MESIGFEWNLETRWDKNYYYAEEFYQTHGHSLPTKKESTRCIKIFLADRFDRKDQNYITRFTCFLATAMPYSVQKRSRFHEPVAYSILYLLYSLSHIDFSSNAE